MKNINTDIQASNRIISIINNSKEQYERILNELENVYVVINDKLEVLDANLRFSSIREGNFFRADVLSYFHPSSSSILQQEIASVVSSKKTSTVELKTIDGRSYLMVISILSINRVEEGTTLKLIGADITELREREGLIMDVFRSVTLGLVMVDTGNLILDGFSQYTKIILEESDLVGKDIFQALIDRNLQKYSAAETKAIADLRAMKPPISKDIFSTLILSLPKMFEIRSNLRSSGKRVVQVGYEPIIEDGIVIKYLMMLQDMSDFMDMNPATLNDDLGKMHKTFDFDPETLSAIFEDVVAMLERVPVKFSGEVSDEIKGVFHSIKGMLRIIGINYLAGLVHQTEEIIKDSGGKIVLHETQPWLDFLSDWNHLHQIYKLCFERLNPAEEAEVKSENPKQQLPKFFQFFGHHSLLSPFYSSSGLSLESSDELRAFCSKSIEKNSIDFGLDVSPILEVDSILLSSTVVRAIKSSLVHFINNSFAHGFAESGQSQSSIQLRIREEEKSIIVDYFDNGSGINVSKLREKLKQTIPAEAIDKLSDVEVANNIFKAGISTKDTVNEVAGRGIGLSGAITDMNLYGGKIELLKFIGGIHFRITSPLLEGQLKSHELVSSTTIQALVEAYFPETTKRENNFHGIFLVPYPEALHLALVKLSERNPNIKVLQLSSDGDAGNQPPLDEVAYLLWLNGISLLSTEACDGLSLSFGKNVCPEVNIATENRSALHLSQKDLIANRLAECKAYIKIYGV